MISWIMSRVDIFYLILPVLSQALTAGRCWPVLAGGGEVGVGRGDNLEAIRVICMIEWGDWCRSHYQHPHYILIDIYISCYV